MNSDVIEINLPCWVIADALDVALTETPHVTTIKVEGRSWMVLFLEEKLTNRFIKETGLVGKLPYPITSIEKLATIIERLQASGIGEVHVFSQNEDGFQRGDVAIEAFLEATREYLSRT